MLPPCLICHFPLSHPTTLMFCGVVEAVMAGSGVWQDCQSLPTRTLHQGVDLTLEATSTAILSTTPLFSGLFVPHDCLFIHVHRPSLFTLTQGRAGGGRSIFLMQNRVKKGHDFLFGGSFSLSHVVRRSVVRAGRAASRARFSAVYVK